MGELEPRHLCCLKQAQLEAVKEECERRIVALRENDKNGTVEVCHVFH